MAQKIDRISCEEASVRIVERIAGEISPERDAGLERHLKTCFTCSADLLDMEQAWQKLSTLPVITPRQELLDRVRLVVRPEYRRPTPAPRARTLVYAYTAIAAAAIVVVAIGYRLLRDVRRPIEQPPQPTARTTPVQPVVVRPAANLSWEPDFADRLQQVSDDVSYLVENRTPEPQEPEYVETVEDRVSEVAWGLEYTEWKWQTLPYSDFDSSLQRMWERIEEIHENIRTENDLPADLEEG
ncbi:MAG: zf-HC2 domain-containing protein [Planctomycetota bacterium]|nr:zf-HC2 domain-containing protein [Planctomycetota bacterium]